MYLNSTLGSKDGAYFIFGAEPFLSTYLDNSKGGAYPHFPSPHPLVPFFISFCWSLPSDDDAFIKEFANHGTILVVSHDLETLQMICDRVIWIEDGVVQSMGAPKDVIARYREAIDGEPEPALAASF